MCYYIEKAAIVLKLCEFLSLKITHRLCRKKELLL